MAIYHLFSNGYYLGKTDKDDGLNIFEWSPANPVTEFKEFDNPITPEPGTDWVEYKVKSLSLTDGREIIIAVHGDEPDKYSIEDLIKI